MSATGGPSLLRWVRRGLRAAAVACAASGAAALVLGGYSLRWSSLRLSSARPERDFAAAVTLALAAALIGDRELARARGDRIAQAAERWAAPVVAALSFLVLAAAWLLGSHYGGGSDSSGYLSEAALWLSGRLHVPESLAVRTGWAWPSMDATVVPLGYRLAVQPGALVPLYPPGFPLTLAAFEAAARTSAAAFAVVPLAAAACVWMTFLIGRRLHSALAGAWAAILLAATPTFVAQAYQPMSDVPATAWWLAAALGALAGTARGALLSGLATSAAILTRPNLAPLAVIPAAWSGLGTAGDVRCGGWRRVLLFAVGAAPGPLGVAWFNTAMYGSAFASGYGDLGALFSLANVPRNLANYASWLWQTHAVFVFAGLAAPALIVAVRHETRPAERRVAWYAASWFAGICLVYVGYLQFDNWTFLRFLLPGIPLMLVLGAWVALTGAGRFPSPSRAVALAVLGLVAADSLGVARGLGVADIRRAERRYFEVADYVRTRLPADAVVVGMQHTGSIRYYAHLTTLRYDLLEPASLDTAVGAVTRDRRRAVLVLDEEEARRFRERFRGQEWGALEWPARARYSGRTSPTVLVWDTQDRERWRHGLPIETVLLQPGNR